jgi:hypothetical protein
LQGNGWTVLAVGGTHSVVRRGYDDDISEAAKGNEADGKAQDERREALST